jgi:pimeloyl-ACP methyl ester carboxylesterase
MTLLEGLMLAALLALAAASAILVRYRRELKRARHATQQGSLIAETAAGRIEYTAQGAGPTLFSIHGAGGGFDQGLVNAAVLVGGGFRIIAPSRFGYLRTPVPQDPSPAAQADAHAALLSTLKVSKAVVLGVSAGARSALELAVRRPDLVAALILIVPAVYASDNPVRVDETRGSKFVFGIVNVGADFAWWAAQKAAPSMLMRFVGVPPQCFAETSRTERNRAANIVASIQPLSLRFPGINIDSAPNLHELPLEGIRAPTLIISARDDLFNTAPAAEYAARRIKGARLAIYDTGGHLLVGRADQARTEARAFLAGAGLIAPSLSAPVMR